MVKVLHSKLEGKTLMLIFLDFDGVTHPVGGGNNYFFTESLNVLRYISEKYEPKFVISSPWKNAYTLKELKSFLPDISHRIIGKTPNYTGAPRDYIRELECRYFVKKNNFSETLIAIDDQAENFNKIPLFLTNPKTGLTVNDIEQFDNFIKSRNLEKNRN